MICQNCSMNSLQLLLGLLWKVLNHYNSRKTCLHDFGSFLYNGANSNKDELTRKTPHHVCIPINFVRVVTNGSRWLCFHSFFIKEPKKKKRITQKDWKILQSKNYFSDANTVVLMMITWESSISCNIEFLDKLMVECKPHYNDYLSPLITQFSSY